ncbi:MAG: right-handed parallel beta-helix repeat-containing protein, partial [Planctomycetota bacterium]
MWNFYVQSYYATRPDPPNEAININPNVLLCWEPGLEVDFHDFYLGTSWEAVNNAIRWDLTGIYQGWTYEPNWPCSGLPTDTKIYWRVDEVHETFWEPDIYKGDVWSFTTAPKRIFVDVDANGANNGSSWANAYNYLQDALIEADSALKPVEIRVAEGIYTPDSNSADPNGSGDRIATFKLIDGVTLKGGYAGYGEANPNARDIELYETILSGDLDGNDVEVNDPCDLLSEPTRAENSYHVVAGDRQGWPDTTVVVDGFTITGGNSNGDFPAGERTGGGMNFCSGKIINCTITGNSAMWGGGMCYSVGEIINCNIKRNFVSGRGGGISYSDVQMTNCTISENSAVQGGGGINNTAGDMMLTNCIFKGNTAREGGAIWYIDGKFGVQTLVNCTFSGNLAEMGGGAIYLSDYSSPTLINCILWGNSYPEIHGTAVVTYSDVEGGWPGLGNIDAYPCFADAYNGDYHLKSQAGRWEPSSESWVQDYVSSPCIDAGNPGCPLGDEPVPNGNQRNMGAYGGTAEASKSPPNWRSIADLTNDWVVDSNDLRIYVDYWLESGECIPSDFDRSQFVDFNDFAIFGLQWSYPTAFEPGMTFQIDDCNMEYGPSWTVVAESNEPRFSVWVEGRYIYFEDLMYANCCPEELGLDKEIN